MKSREGSLRSFFYIGTHLRALSFACSFSQMFPAKMPSWYSDAANTTKGQAMTLSSSPNDPTNENDAQRARQLEHTTRDSDSVAQLTLLGNKHVHYSSDYDPTLLETFDNKHADHDYMVTFRCPEFTTLCPITGQPDFATMYINYIPNIKMVESKSLKLYLFSFRNHGDFHEDVTNIIMKDLVALMDPKYIEVRGMFYPRGGISIYPFVNWANPKFGYQAIAQERMFAQLSDLDRGDGAR